MIADLGSLAACMEFPSEHLKNNSKHVVKKDMSTHKYLRVKKLQLPTK